MPAICYAPPSTSVSRGRDCIDAWKSTGYSAMSRSKAGASGLLVALPALLALGGVLLAGLPSSFAEAGLLFVLIALLTVAAWRFVGGRASRMQSVVNLLEALREGDYGVR